MLCSFLLLRHDFVMSNIGDLGIMELEAFTVFGNPTPTHDQPFSMLCSFLLLRQIGDLGIMEWDFFAGSVRVSQE
jgi:hypothetical protein